MWADKGCFLERIPGYHQPTLFHHQVSREHHPYIQILKETFFLEDFPKKIKLMWPKGLTMLKAHKANVKEDIIPAFRSFES